MREALKDELTPHIVGLKRLMERFIKVAERTHKENLEDTKDVRVSNPEPKIKKVEVQNTKEQIEAIGNVEKAVDDQTQKTESQFINFGSYLKSLGFGISKLVTFLTADAKEVKTVNVENLDDVQIPKEIEVTVKNFPEQEKQNDRVFITNSKVEEAIPVVLTSSDRKKFYTVMSALFGGGSGGTPQGVLDLLKQIKANTEQLELISFIDKKVTVGTTSLSILSANTKRREVILTKKSQGGDITINRSGSPAVDGEGIVLTAKGSSYVMDTNGLFLGEFFAISSTSGSILSISEGSIA